jgi:hypothetical protein
MRGAWTWPVSSLDNLRRALRMLSTGICLSLVQRRRGSRMTSRIALLAVLTVAGLALVAPSGAFASFTFGADLSQAVAVQPCNSCDAVTITKSDGTPETGSPISGVLVSAQIRTAGDAATGNFLILHPTSTANEFRNDGQVPITVPLDATAGGTIRPAVPARLKIAAGDRLGISFPGTQPGYMHSDSDASCASRLAGHTLGTSVGYNPFACGPYEILIQGTVEADADGDGYGDETQDQCPSDAALQTACPEMAPPMAPPAAAPTGQRAGALKKCEKKKSKRARKKCRTRAKKLPV